jgi:hypothetical protein
VPGLDSSGSKPRNPLASSSSAHTVLGLWKTCRSLHAASIDAHQLGRDSYAPNQFQVQLVFSTAASRAPLMVTLPSPHFPFLPAIEQGSIRVLKRARLRRCRGGDVGPTQSACGPTMSRALRGGGASMTASSSCSSLWLSGAAFGSLWKPLGCNSHSPARLHLSCLNRG